MTSRPLERLRRPEQIIGRRKQLEKIDAALAAFDGRVLFFYGDGGMGKTRLVQEVGIRAAMRERTLVLPLIDLFLARYLQPLALMDAVADGLVEQLKAHDPDLAANAFKVYRAEAALAARDFTRSREPARHAFLADYQAIVDSGYEVVLMLDTFEKLNPSIVGTEEFNFRESHRFENWLIETIARLPGTLVVIAGRNVPRQRQAVAEHLQSTLIQPTKFLVEIEVGRFLPEDTRAFIDAYLQYSDPTEAPTDETPVSGPSLNDTEYEDLSNIADGRPVVLALAVELWRYGLIDLPTITDELRRGYPDNLAELGHLLVTYILNDLADRDGRAERFLVKAVYLRKGVTLQLLAAIAQQERSRETHEEEFEFFSGLVFVKSHPDEGLLTLHDEMYELLLDMEGDWGLRRSPVWFDVAYDQAQQVLKSADDAKSGATPLTRMRRQAWQLELLFYEMARNPVTGYQLYRELSYNTILAKEIDFDDQLQYELARFFEAGKKWGEHYRRQLEQHGLPWEQVAFDENVRWIHRRHQETLPNGAHITVAMHWAQRLHDRLPPGAQAEALALEVARLESARYDNQQRKSVGNHYRDVINKLTRLSEQFAEQGTRDAIIRANWRYTTLLLALAHNDFGYFERTRQNLDTAVHEYGEADKQLRKLGEDTNRLIRATTLNNLGFARAQQGQFEGQDNVRSALEVFMRQGALLLEARARNTRARILTLRDNNREALREVRQARAVFLEERERARRDLGLCCMAEGDILRRIVRRVQDPDDPEIELFDLAIARYQEAIELVNQAKEVDRQIEAYHCLGKAYRDRAYWRQRHNLDPIADWQQALESFDRAIAVAQDEQVSQAYGPIIASVYQDKAIVYYNQGKALETESTLEEARAAIPKRYDIVSMQGITSSGETEQLRIFWQRLAMVEFYYGRLRMYQREHEEGCVRFVRAFACARHYASDYRGLPEMTELTLEHLLKIEDRDLLNDLRDMTYLKSGHFNLFDVYRLDMEPLFDRAIEG